MIPTVPLTGLSPAAYDLYKTVARDDEPQIDIAADDTDKIAAATELAEAGYGTLRITQKYGSTLWVTPIAKGFSVARRDNADWPGYLYLEVEILKHSTDRRGILLACLYGAKFANRSQQGAPWPTWLAEVHHDTARDVDHDASVLARLEINNPVLLTHDGFSTTFVGTLNEMRMWPTDTDVTLLSPHDDMVRDEPTMCDYGNCATNPHPVAPYIAPKRDDLKRHENRTVRITTIPLNLVNANGMHISRTPVTRADY